MSSTTTSPILRSAAWRISLWATLAFACGTIIVFLFLHHFVADDIQQRTDVWLSGEVQVLESIAERTPADGLHSQFVAEVAELEGKEIPNRLPAGSNMNESVFFLQTSESGELKLWVGEGSAELTLAALRAREIKPDTHVDLQVSGTPTPFRVVWTRVDDGSRIYLGLSERDQILALNRIRFRFILLWMAFVLFDFAVVFVTTRSMLNHVRQITEAASRIGLSDLETRVPTTKRSDEVAHLARTLNHMLDRIESSMYQLHTVTDSLAHDLRSPLTAIRGKLEVALSSVTRPKEFDPLVSAIEELDRLTEFLNQSLDIAEAKAGALLLVRGEIDLDELLRAMIDLYEPSMVEKGLKVRLHSAGPVKVLADAGMIHRMISNLFDNELKHLPAACTVTIQLRAVDGTALLVLEDDGPGFGPEVVSQLFERGVKGRQSKGHGLGLAFIDAVTRAHDGTITAANRSIGGVTIRITFPLASSEHADLSIALSTDSTKSTR